MAVSLVLSACGGQTLIDLSQPHVAGPDRSAVRRPDELTRNVLALVGQLTAPTVHVQRGGQLGRGARSTASKAVGGQVHGELACHQPAEPTPLLTNLEVLGEWVLPLLYEGVEEV